MPERLGGTSHINLTDEEKLYALRCVYQMWKPTFWPSSKELGIAKRVMKSLEADGLVERAGLLVGDMWGLTPEGVEWMQGRGGEFKYG